MGNNRIDEDVMPVFQSTVFWKAETQFLEFMDQEYFSFRGKTLLIVCEEGIQNMMKRS